MSIDKHVTLIAVLHIVHSAVLILLALVLFALLTIIGAASCDETAFFVLGLIASIIGFILMVVALPGLVGAIGLLMRKPWGRIVTLIVSFFKLADLPIGTALGIYSIVILFRDDAQRFFAGNEPTKAVATI